MKIVSVMNLTTNEDLLLKASNIDLEVVEIGRHHVVFDMPIKQQKFYSNLMLKGSITVKSKEVPFEFIGKVTSNEDLDHATRLHIDLLQYDKQLWVEFLNSGKEKQEHADRVFRMIRGEE